MLTFGITGDMNSGRFQTESNPSIYLALLRLCCSLYLPPFFSPAIFTTATSVCCSGLQESASTDLYSHVFAEDNLEEVIVDGSE